MARETEIIFHDAFITFKAIFIICNMILGALNAFIIFRNEALISLTFHAVISLRYITFFACFTLLLGIQDLTRTANRIYLGTLPVLKNESIGAIYARIVLRVLFDSAFEAKVVSNNAVLVARIAIIVHDYVALRTRNTFIISANSSFWAFCADVIFDKGEPLLVTDTLTFEAHIVHTDLIRLTFETLIVIAD